MLLSCKLLMNLPLAISINDKNPSRCWFLFNFLPNDIEIQTFWTPWFSYFENCWVLYMKCKEQSPLVVISFLSSSLKLSIEYHFLIRQGVVSKQLNNDLNEVKQWKLNTTSPEHFQNSIRKIIEEKQTSRFPLTHIHFCNVFLFQNRSSSFGFSFALDDYIS